jgi:hypothetical protein
MLRKKVRVKKTKSYKVYYYLLPGIGTAENVGYIRQIQINNTGNM